VSDYIEEDVSKNRMASSSLYITLPSPFVSSKQRDWNEWGWGFNVHLEDIFFATLLYITIWVREPDSSSI